MTKEELSFHWDYFTNISKDFEATDRYVSHTSLGSRNNNKTFSLEFLKLLMIICAEFETMCKLIISILIILLILNLKLKCILYYLRLYQHTPK